MPTRSGLATCLLETCLPDSTLAPRLVNTDAPVVIRERLALYLLGVYEATVVVPPGAFVKDALGEVGKIVRRDGNAAIPVLRNAC